MRGRSGKFEIKYIENSTNRQVTYSKRKKGILKKAREITILCNAQVSLIMFPKSRQNAEYVSPSTTMKDFFDRYQRETNIDLWAAQYEALQEELRAQQEIGRRLKKDIRQRTGQDDLREFSIEELRSFEKNLEESLKIVRDRKGFYLFVLYIYGAHSQKIFLEETRNPLLRLYAHKEEREFFHPVPANNERNHQPNYGSVSSLMKSESIDGRGGDFESSEITFQPLLQPSHTNLHNEAGGAYWYNQTFA
ncbi:hypothetical protein MKW92_032527 [Papaver armeniacum]|nr:hypothetical protein MKW92_032527 [Papaver armeniacum]